MVAWQGTTTQCRSAAAKHNAAAACNRLSHHQSICCYVKQKQLKKTQEKRRNTLKVLNKGSFQSCNWVVLSFSWFISLHGHMRWSTGKWMLKKKKNPPALQVFFFLGDWGSPHLAKILSIPTSTLVPIFGPRLVPPLQPRFVPKIWKIQIHFCVKFDYF